MEINKHLLNEGQFIKQTTPKSLIVLHHTVSSGAPEAVIDYFNSSSERVAVSYIIGKDGKIIECFSPEYWAYHLGKGTTSLHNQKSIGIEIINEGGLVLKENKYYWFDGKYEYKGIPYRVDFRGYKFFASYNYSQYKSTAWLINYLCSRFKISRNIYEPFDYNKSLLNSFSGVIKHSNVRSDKSDISPAFDIKLLTKLMNLTYEKNP